MEIEFAEAPAWAGVDTHKDTNTLALLDGARRVMGTWQFPTGNAGYAQLAERIGDTSVPVGIEGTGSYGAGLAEHLRCLGHDVYEMVRPKKEQHRRGKSDPIDAIAAAENLAAGKGLAPKEFEGREDDVRWLMAAREQIVRHAVAMANAVKAMLVKAPDDVRQAYAGMDTPELMAALAASRSKDACRRSMRLLAKRWTRAQEEADELEAEIESLLKETRPALIGAFGVGTIAAARLVVAAGSNPERMGSEAAFSMLCGTSPIPVSSGRKDRFRLNRGGDRQANRAIHEIVRARMAREERTRSYIAKKLSEGKTKKEAIRCACRYVSREVYKLMTGPQLPLPDPRELVEHRKALGIRQKDVASALGLTLNQISCIEQGKTVEGDRLRAYDSFLASVEKLDQNGCVQSVENVNRQS